MEKAIITITKEVKYTKKLIWPEPKLNQEKKIDANLK